MPAPVDDLFGGGVAPPPPPSPVPRLRRLWLVALLLTLAGPLLCTGVPGALLAVWVWMRVGECAMLVESGVLPVEEGVRVATLRRHAFRLLLLVAAGLMTTLVLFGVGFYAAAMEWLGGWLAGGGGV